MQQDATPSSKRKTHENGPIVLVILSRQAGTGRDNLDF